MKKFLSLSATVFVMAGTPFAFQKPDSDVTKSSAKLTEEEQEIIKNREILENLDLLQNFDKLQLLDLLAGEDARKAKSPAKQKPKKDERKEK